MIGIRGALRIQGLLDSCDYWILGISHDSSILGILGIMDHLDNQGIPGIWGNSGMASWGALNLSFRRCHEQGSKVYSICVVLSPQHMCQPFKYRWCILWVCWILRHDLIMRVLMPGILNVSLSQFHIVVIEQ